MAWDTLGNVPLDAPSIRSALEDWEADIAPSSIDDWEVTRTGPARCVITIQYSTA